MLISRIARLLESMVIGAYVLPAASAEPRTERAPVLSSSHLAPPSWSPWPWVRKTAYSG
jgi:hypothetical protein